MPAKKYPLEPLQRELLLTLFEHPQPHGATLPYLRLLLLQHVETEPPAHQVVLHLDKLAQRGFVRSFNPSQPHKLTRWKIAQAGEAALRSSSGPSPDEE